MNFHGPVLPLFALLASMLIITMMRVAVPVGQRTEGATLKHVTLSYRERMLLQRTNFYAIGAVLLITSVAGLMPLPVQLAVVAAAFVIVAVPVRYTLTTKGIALNNVVFRKWDEFSGYELRGSRIRLVGRQGKSSFTVSLMSAKRPEIVKMVERLVGESEGETAERAAHAPTRSKSQAVSARR